MTKTGARAHILELMSSTQDFPKPGILFRDLTPVFADPAAFASVVDELVAPFTGQFDVVAGVEARGFLLAAAAARASGTGVIAIRKAGKLPPPVLAESFDLEYGSATLELHKSAVAGQRMLLLDDLLATGGTLAAAATLSERAGYTVVGVGVVIELDDLGGRAALPGRDIRSLIVL